MTLKNLCPLLLAIAISFHSFFAYASTPKPRIDLYQKIKNETGVSLKEAYEAVEGKNHFASVSLQMYAKKMGTKEVERSINEEISYRQVYCKIMKGSTCTESIEELQSQLKFVVDLAKNIEKQSGQKKLYFYLTLYNFQIKNNVLKDEFVNWDKNCSSQKKSIRLHAKKSSTAFTT